MELHVPNGTGRHPRLPASVVRESGEKILRASTAVRASTAEGLQSKGKDTKITVLFSQAKK